MEENILIKYWDKDHLRKARDEYFAQVCVPVIDTKDNDLLATLLAKLPGMKTPKPDLAYGFGGPGTFSEIKREINDLYPHFSEVSKLLYHTFFIAEFKSHQGSTEDAENQTCRGGASTTSATIGLKGLAGIVDSDDGHDDDGSLAFSLAMTPTLAGLYVHRDGCSRNGEPAYHMYSVSSYVLGQEDDYPRLRTAINNMLAWGVDMRKAYIKVVLADVQERVPNPKTWKSFGLSTRSSTEAWMKGRETASASRSGDEIS